MHLLSTRFKFLLEFVAFKLLKSDSVILGHLVRNTRFKCMMTGD